MTQPLRAGIVVLAAFLSLAPLGEHAAFAQLAPKGPAATMTTQPTKPETIEQRIASLKADMQITPDETDTWNAVAAVMRSNAADMEKLAADRRAQSTADITALDDLLTYQAFAQAHVDGLANLTKTFTVLYNQMPDAQKKVADGVFRGFGRPRAHGKG